MWKCKFKEESYIFLRDGVEIYDIPVKRCNTEAKANEWIAHMEDKNWWNDELEAEFIRLWKKQNGFTTN